MSDKHIESPWHIRYNKVGERADLNTEELARLSELVMSVMDEAAMLGIVIEIQVDRPDDLAEWAKMRAERMAMFPPSKRLGYIESK